jgi:hypothetical protein
MFEVWDSVSGSMCRPLVIGRERPLSLVIAGLVARRLVVATTSIDSSVVLLKRQGSIYDSGPLRAGFASDTLLGTAIKPFFPFDV